MGKATSIIAVLMKWFFKRTYFVHLENSFDSLQNMINPKPATMATYKCRKCGIRKNDTLNSQLNTSVTCSAKEKDANVVFHSWEKLSEEDLICN